jgi:hypothetical protein
MPRDGGAANPTGLQTRVIKGSKGVVVGDGATVYQYFGEAPPSLSSLIRIREFQTLIEDRTRNFVGRDFVFRAIDEDLKDPDFPSGYILVQGEPGIGKTAVLAQLVKLRGYAHHFNISTQNIRSPRAFLGNICAQLIVRYGLPHPTLPPEAREDGGFLGTLLGEAAERSPDQPVVVLVDALDEAEDSGIPSGANRLYLPSVLPRGVYFVVTTREQYDYRLFIDERRDIYLRDGDPRNTEDIRAYVLQFINQHSDAMNARLAEWGVGSGEFLEILSSRSEGNFMYLVLVLRDVLDGKVSRDTLGEITKLPQGLRAYYRRHWTSMADQDQEHFRRYQQPVVCLLATAREPVSVGQLVEWTRQDWRRQGWKSDQVDAKSVADVIKAWREFLNEDDESGEAHYRVYHASFQDFLRDEVGLTVYHEAISTAALAKIPGFLAGQ